MTTVVYDGMLFPTQSKLVQAFAADVLRDEQRKRAATYPNDAFSMRY